MPEQFTDSLNSAVKKYNKIAMMNAKENGKIFERVSNEFKREEGALLLG